MGHWFAGTFLHEHCKIHLSIALGPAFPFYFTFSCIAPLARCSVEFGYGVEYFGGWRRVGNDFLTEAWSLQRMRFVLNAATAPVPSEPRAEVSSPGDTAALCHGPGEQRCIVLVRLWWLWQSVKWHFWNGLGVIFSNRHEITLPLAGLLQGFSQISGATPARLWMCLSPWNPIKNATAVTNYDFVSIYIFSDGHMSVINPELNWRSAGFAAAAGTRSESSWYPCVSWYWWVSWDCRLNN